jgi:hypothetical protein
VLAFFEQRLPRWRGALSISPGERWMLPPIMEAFVSRLLLVSGVAF